MPTRSALCLCCRPKSFGIGSVRCYICSCVASIGCVNEYMSHMLYYIYVGYATSTTTTAPPYTPIWTLRFSSHFIRCTLRRIGTVMWRILQCPLPTNVQHTNREHGLSTSVLSLSWELFKMSISLVLDLFSLFEIYFTIICVCLLLVAKEHHSYYILGTGLAFFTTHTYYILTNEGAYIQS